MTDEALKARIARMQDTIDMLDGIVGTDNTQIEALTARLAEVEAESDRRFELIQALLDAVKGTIDTHAQIADHPNVKFVQMQRLHWEQVEAERDQPKDDYWRRVKASDVATFRESPPREPVAACPQCEAVPQCAVCGTTCNTCLGDCE